MIRPDIAARFAAIRAKAEARVDAELAAIEIDPEFAAGAWRGKNGPPAMKRRGRQSMRAGIDAQAAQRKARKTDTYGL